MFDLGISMNKRQLLALCLCTAVVTFNGTITVGLEPVYAVHLGADPATTGIFVALAFLTVTLGNICGGWLSDRLGRRKPLLLMSCAIWSVTALLMTQAVDMRGLILTTALFWFPGGIALAMVNIIAGLSTIQSGRGKVFGWIAVASGGGGLLAGAVGGPVADRWGFAWLFVVMGGTVLLMLAIALMIEDKPTPPVASTKASLDGSPASRQPSIGRLLIFLLAAQLLVRLGQLIAGLGSPLVMTRLGFDAAEVSSAIAVSAAVTLPLPLILGWLSDGAGRKRFLLLGYGACAIGLLTLVSAAWLWQFWLSASLIAIAQSSNGVAQALVADLVPPQAMGRGMSLFSTANLVAGIVGTGGGGYLLQTLGMGPGLLLAILLPVTGMLLVLLIPRPVPIVQVA
jgi:MFS family permease